MNLDYILKVRNSGSIEGILNNELVIHIKIGTFLGYNLIIGFSVT